MSFFREDASSVAISRINILTTVTCSGAQPLGASRTFCADLRSFMMLYFLWQNASPMWAKAYGKPQMIKYLTGVP